MAVQKSNTANTIFKTAAAVVESQSLAPAQAAGENTEAKESVQTLEKDTSDMATQPEFTAAPEAQVKPTFTKLQDSARLAYEKSTAVASELGNLTKGNIEAVFESGKILGTGVKNLGQEYLGASKVAAKVVAADLKDLAAVRSPAEFFKLQEKILRRNIGTSFALSTKNGEALAQLSKDAAAPITRRVNATVEKISTTA
jgi:hypothetical protein